MADQIPKHDDPEYKNFIVGLRGFSYVGNSLESFTREGLNKLQAKISARLGGGQCCSKRCSNQLRDSQL